MHRDGMEWGGNPPGRGGESCVHRTEDRQGDGCNEEDAGRDVRMRNLRLASLIPWDPKHGVFCEQAELQNQCESIQSVRINTIVREIDDGLHNLE